MIWTLFSRKQKRTRKLVTSELPLWVGLRGMAGFPPNPPEGFDIPGFTTQLSDFHILVHTQFRLGWANEFTCPNESRTRDQRRKPPLKWGLRKEKGWKNKSSMTRLCQNRTWCWMSFQSFNTYLLNTYYGKTLIVHIILIQYIVYITHCP